MYPHINRLSDHDAQIIKLNNLNTQGQYNTTQIIRNFNKHSITNFKFKPSVETWDDIFGGNDVNIIFNNFLNTFRTGDILVCIWILKRGGPVTY
jgi:cystathionine beta-lyase family protein involved in aluminum resistance